MKVFINTTNWAIVKIDNEFPVIAGDNYVDMLTVYYDANPSTIGIYPTLNVLKPNGRKIGAIMYDPGTIENPIPQTYTDADSNTWYGFPFTLAAHDGILTTPGKLQVTITTNKYNLTTNAIIGQRNTNVQLEVLNAVVNDNQDIIVVGSDLDDTVTSFGEQITALQGLVAGLTNSKYDKANIGYIELTTDSGTLTQDQLNEAQKKYCIINKSELDENILYYKLSSLQNEDDDDISFVYMYASVTNNILYLNRKTIVVDRETGAYTTSSMISQTYTTAKADELLDTKVNKTTTVNGHALSGNVTVTKGDVGLGNVDNTSDLNKPISTATQNALDILTASIVASGHNIALECDSDFKLLAKLKDANNNVISTSNVIDLPLESVVVSGSYDDTTKKVVLTLENGSTIEFSVADLISGLQSEITAQNKLESDLVDDTNQTNKFVSASEKAQITQNENDIAGMLDGTKEFEKVSTEDIDITSDSGKIKFISGTSEIYEYNNQDEDDVLVVNGADISRLTTKANNSGKVEVNGKDVNIEGEDLNAVADYVDINGTENLTIKSGNSNKIVIDSYYDDINITTPKLNYNNEEVATKPYVEQKINEFAWFLGTYDLSVDNDSTTAYTKSVPSGATMCHINKVGGMSYKSDNLIELTNIQETTTNGITYKIENGVITLNGTATANININLILNSTVYPTGIFATFNSQANSNVSIYNLKSNGAWGSIGFGLSTVNRTYTINDNTDLYGFRLYIKADTEVSNFVIKPFYIKGSTAPTEFKQGFTGIRDSAVSSVVSKDSNNTTLETKTIDANIQALNGYGCGINDTCYNYIDFENNKFVQKVGRVDLGTLDYTYNSQYSYFKVDSNIGIKLVGFNTATNSLCALYEAVAQNAFTSSDKVMFIVNSQNLAIKNTDYTDTTAFKTAMSGVYLYYELATPVETDISQYITTNKITIEAGGTLTFTNTYNQAVPSDIDYLKEVAK